MYRRKGSRSLAACAGSTGMAVLTCGPHCPALIAVLASSARVFAPPRMDLQAEADRPIIARGVAERALLQAGTPLLAVEQRRAPAIGTPRGFGAATAPPKPAKKKDKGKVKSKQASAPPRRLSSLAVEMKKSGVVRIDGALSPETTAALRDFVDSERASAMADVAAGRCPSASRFANLVLLENRCDLLLPLRGPCITALDELIGEGSVLGPLLTELAGDAAKLQEIACLISDPGSKQQPIHPDTPFTSEPTLYAAFVALQDVSLEMGPTVYLPGTHTHECHSSFYGGDLERGKDQTGWRQAPIAEAFLQTRPVVLGTLKAGDVALYNQQVLHCGSANESPDRKRRQFYISFRNPTVPFEGHSSIPWSMRPSFKDALTLGAMREELRLLDGTTTRVAEGGGAGLFGERDAIDCASTPLCDL